MHMRKMTRLCALLLALLLPWGALGETDISLSVGYDGLITYGKALPVTIRLENHGEDFSGVAAIDIAVSRTEYNRYEQEFFLAAGAVKEFCFPVRIDSRQTRFTAELLQDGKQIAARTVEAVRVVSPSAGLIGVLSDDAQRLSYMNIDRDSDELYRSEYWQIVPLTRETFPAEERLMQSFSILAIDGFDLAALSPAQQSVLENWLLEGGLVLLGGGGQGAASFPYFEALCGLSAGAAHPAEDATPALLEALGVSGEAAGEDFLLSSLSGGTTVIAQGDTPLIQRAQAGGGLVYAAAFSLGEAPFRAWRYAHSFWQRLLLMDCLDFYHQRLYAGTGSDQSMFYLAAEIPLENDGALAPALLIAAALPLGALLFYFLLRRLDKRQWLWLALPLWTAACALGVWGVARNTEMNQPVALSVSTLRQDANGGWTQETSLAVAAGQTGMHVVSSPRGELLPSSESYYDYYDDSAPASPTKQRYRFLAGAQSGVALDLSAPWTRQYFSLSLGAAARAVEGAVWMEADGAHGTLTNRTGYPLTEGAVFTPYGFCAVPALENGESYEFSLLWASLNDLDNPVYEPGEMYERLLSSESYSAFISEYFYHSTHLKPGRTISADPVTSLRASIAYNLVGSGRGGSSWGQGSWRSVNRGFYYLAFCPALQPTGLLLDGVEIPRQQGEGAVCALLPFQSVSPQGLICRMPGQDRSVRCQTTKENAPLSETYPESGRYYYEASEWPAFRFVLDTANIQISSLTLQADSWGGNLEMYLYDGKEWISQALNTRVENPGRFIDAEGQLFVQFRGAGNASVTAPTLLLEGRAR